MRLESVIPAFTQREKNGFVLPDKLVGAIGRQYREKER
jgi:hypothetical protein